MKVLLTGATGLIGSALTELLLSNGHEVHYLTTRTSQLKNQPNLKGFIWNPSQGTYDRNAFIDVDAVVHLAGASITKPWTKKYKFEILESRINATNTLYKALKEVPHQVTQFITASGIAVYPNSSTQIYTEDFVGAAPGFLSHVVEKWEESAQKFKQLNLQVCCMRTGVVLAKDAGALPQMLQPIKIGVGAAIGSGQQHISWIHLDDITRFYQSALEHKWQGVYNAVAPEPVTNAVLTSKIAERLDKKIWLPNIPQKVIEILLGERSILVTADQIVKPQRALDAHFQYKFPDIDSALGNLIP
jgi:hypothetical protein